MEVQKQFSLLWEDVIVSLTMALDGDKTIADTPVR
jgi:hypothetical protein